MTPVIGEYSLAAAVLVAGAAIFACALGATSKARWLLAGFAGLVTLSAATLMNLMMGNHFEVAYIASYSERALPTGFKIAAFWAGQEGSLLLWAWFLAVMTLLVVVQQRKRADAEHRATLATLAVVCGFFAALLLFAANPFAIQRPIPADGHGLNQLLQDPGMIAHPPLLFLGYAGFTVPFAMMVGALAARRKDDEWIAGVRPWVLASWVFLSAGILLGAEWAYVELGWGGYWAWDPVENASLLPWLIGTAVVHSLMAQRHRRMFRTWNASLLAAAFLLCIFGTYLTRSGIIDSVHSFPKSAIGTFFLVFLALGTFGSAALIVARRGVLRGEPIESLVSKEGAFLATNVLLVIITLTTMAGTVSPMIGNIVGKPVTVGQPFYNSVVVPMALLLAALMALGPLLTSGKDASRHFGVRLIVPATVTILALLATVAWAAVAWRMRSYTPDSRDGWVLVVIGIAVLAGSAMVTDLAAIAWKRSSTAANPLSSILHLIDDNHRRYGGQLVHLGMVMIVLGVAGSSVYGDKTTLKMREGESATVAGRTLTLEKVAEKRIENFTAVEASVSLMDAKGRTARLSPQVRYYDKSREQPNSEVAIESSPKEDLYVTLAGWEDGGKTVALQVIINPLVMWIWIGGIVAALGGIFCSLPRLLSRRATAETPTETKIAPKDRRVPARTASPASH